MKNLIYFLTLTLFVACSGNQQPDSDTKTEQQKPAPEFPKYATVLEMLNAASDYKEEDGNLKILSDEPLHVQVSNWFFDGDLEETMTEQVKRDIVYVSFQAFAETGINEITVTSVPLKMKDFKTRDKYLDKYKTTVTVSRETAKKILEKYLYTQSFQDLYQLYQGEIWIPNDNFNKLKFEQLNSVFNDLTK